MRVGKPAGTNGPRGNFISQGEPIAQGDKVRKKQGFPKKTRDFLLNSTDVKRAFTPEDIMVLCGHRGRDSAPCMEAPRAIQCPPKCLRHPHGAGGSDKGPARSGIEGKNTWRLGSTLGCLSCQKTLR